MRGGIYVLNNDRLCMLWVANSYHDIVAAFEARDIEGAAALSRLHRREGAQAEVLHDGTG